MSEVNQNEQNQVETYEQEVTYQNYDEVAKYQGTKVLRQDLDGLNNLFLKDLERLREDEIERLTENELDTSNVSLYDKLTNLTYKNLAPVESHIVKELMEAKEYSKIPHNEPKGVDAGERIRLLEEKVRTITLYSLIEGNMVEEFEYNSDGEIKKLKVTGDIDYETEFFYKSETSNLSPGEDDLLVGQVTRLRNEKKQKIEVSKKYHYNSLEDIVKIETDTVVYDTPPEKPVVLDVTSLISGMVNITMEAHPNPEFKHFLIYEIQEDGSEILVLETSNLEIEFETESGEKMFAIKAQDESFNISEGEIIGPISVL